MIQLCKRKNSISPNGLGPNASHTPVVNNAFDVGVSPPKFQNMFLQWNCQCFALALRRKIVDRRREDKEKMAPLMLTTTSMW